MFDVVFEHDLEQGDEGCVDKKEQAHLPRTSAITFCSQE